MTSMTFTSATDPDLKLTFDAYELLPGAAFILRVTDPELWGDRDRLRHCAATIREGLGEDTRFVMVGPELEVYIVGRVA